MGLPSGAEINDLGNLAQRIHQGDQSAESALANEFGPKILVMALARTRDRELARELVQDTLLAVIEALRKGQLLDCEKLAAFIHGTARNLINNYFRNERHKPRLEPLRDVLAHNDTIGQMEHAEQVRLVHQALEQLHHQDRNVLWLTLVEGRKPGEIASMLGVTSEAVRTRKLRAVKKVAELIRTKMSRT